MNCINIRMNDPTVGQISCYRGTEVLALRTSVSRSDQCITRNEISINAGMYMDDRHIVFDFLTFPSRCISVA